MALFRTFRITALVGVIALVTAWFYGGSAALATTAILIALEIVFSFDNATVNSSYLKRMNPFWRSIFLTVGVLIAVVGMRLLFPFVVVCLSGHVSPAHAISLAIAKGDPNTAGTYGYILEHAHPAIAGFGGAFLLMLFLDFMLDQDRDIMWLAPIERQLAKLGRLDVASVVITLAFVAALYFLVLPPTTGPTVLIAAVLGTIAYLLVNGMTAVMETSDERRRQAMGISDDDNSPAPTRNAATLLLAGRAAFTMFLFLEVMDASFSFDGVIGAFAITADPIIIALGLGVGALAVRSLTVYLVNAGTLDELVHLETGAHWAIGSLAVLMLLSTHYGLPSLLIGAIGITFIAASFISSLAARKNDDNSNNSTPAAVPQS